MCVKPNSDLGQGIDNLRQQAQPKPPPVAPPPQPIAPRVSNDTNQQDAPDLSIPKKRKGGYGQLSTRSSGSSGSGSGLNVPY